MQINENSFYTDAVSKANFLKDKQQVMDAFMISFFGFLGLFKLSDVRGYLKTYETSEGKLQITSIGDTNHDVSLAIKLAFDQGMLKSDTVNKMTRLLSLIKQKSIKGKNLDESLVRAFLTDIQYDTHRPSPPVLNLIKQFHNGQISLVLLGKELYDCVRMHQKQLGPASGEFMDLVKKGGYPAYFSKFGTAADIWSGAASKPATQMTTNTTTSPATKSPKAAPVAKKGYGIDFINELIHNAYEPLDKLKALQKEYGITKTEIVANPNVASAPFDLLRIELNKRFNDWTPTPSLTPRKVPRFSEMGLLAYLDQFSRTKDIRTNVAKVYLMEGLRVAAQDMDKFDTIEAGAASLAKGNWASWGKIQQSHEYKTVIENLNRIRKDAFAKSSTAAGFKLALLPYATNFAWDTLGLKYLEFGAFSTRPLPIEVDDFFDSDTIKAMEYTMDIQAKIRMLVTVKDKFGTTNIENMVGLINHSIKWLESLGQGMYNKIKRGDTYKLYLYKQKLEHLSGNQKKFFDDLTKKFPDFFESIEDANDAKFREMALRDAVHNIINTYKYSNDLLTAGRDFDWNSYTDKEIREMIVAEQLVLDVLEKFIYVGINSVQQWVSDKKTMKVAKVIAGLTDLLAPTTNGDQAAKLNNLVNKLSLGRVLAMLDSKIIDETVGKKIALHIINDPDSYSYDSTKTQITGKGYSSTSLTTQDAVDNRKLFLKHCKITDIPMSTGFWVVYLFDGYDVSGLPKGGGDSAVEAVGKCMNYVMKFDADLVVNLPIPKEIALERKKKAFDIIIDEFGEDAVKAYHMTYKYNLFIDMIKIPSIRKEWLENPSAYEASMSSLDRPNADRLPAKNIAKDVEFFKDYFKALNNLAASYCPRIRLACTDPHELRTAATDPNYGKVLVSRISNYSHNVGIDMIFDVLGNVPIKQTAKHINMLRHFEELIMKDTRGYDSSQRQAFASKIGEHYAKMIVDNPTEMEEIVNGVKGHIRRAIADQLVGGRFFNDVKTALFDAACPIKPFMKLDDNRIEQILKYNRINIASVNLRGHISVKEIERQIDQFSKQMKSMNVTREEGLNTDEHWERMSVEYDRFNKYRHGNIAVIFKSTFNVALPKQQTGYATFKAKKPNTKEMSPVFHGTGSIAASMILRFGFAVISSNDSSVVGRMLGDGIYFSTVLDKVSQYVSDGGYSRGIGNKGYIFEMSALLGDERTDFRAAGTGGDSIRSPEWCVYSPNEQLRIDKAHLIELVRKEDMDELKKKYPDIKAESNVMKITKFSQFLKETTVSGKVCSTFTFQDGMIPIAKDKRVEFEELEAEGALPDGVTLDYSGIGPMITIEHDGTESEAYCIRNTADFMETEEYQDLFQKYIGFFVYKT